MDVCKVEILDLDGYVPGVKTTMEGKQAEAMAKAGRVKILETESNKLSPEGSKKTGGKKDEKDK